MKGLAWIEWGKGYKEANEHDEKHTKQSNKVYSSISQFFHTYVHASSRVTLQKILLDQAVDLLGTQRLGADFIEPAAGAVAELRTVRGDSHDQLAGRADSGLQPVRLELAEATNHLWKQTKGEK